VLHGDVADGSVAGRIRAVAPPDLSDPILVPHPRRHGFTLIEMMMVTVIMGILAALAIPGYSRIRERAQVAKAIGDIKALQLDIQDYQLRNAGQVPAGLSMVGRAAFSDPWGNPYQYQPLSSKGNGNGGGGGRKDRFRVPLNSDFDLYSMGADGKSSGPLSTKVSQDDIIRANDGGFIGLAKNF